MASGPYKSRGCEQVDQYYASDTGARLAEAAAWLDAGSAEAAAQKFVDGGHMPPGEMPRFRNGWPKANDAKLKVGYRKAIRLALGHNPPKRIDSWWMSGAPTFKVVVNDVSGGPVVVTVHVRDQRPYGSEAAETRTYEIGSRADLGLSPDAPCVMLDGEDEEIVMIQTSGAPDPEMQSAD
jgi:hypothetical protein